jgi:hypothetical protein
VSSLFEPDELLEELGSGPGPRRLEALEMLRIEAQVFYRWSVEGLAEVARLMAVAAEDGSWAERRAAVTAEVAFARVVPAVVLGQLWQSRARVAAAAVWNLVECLESFEELRGLRVRDNLQAISDAARSLPGCANSCAALDMLLGADS